MICLTGLNLDTVWENIIKTIGEIQVQGGKTLTEQIQDDEYQTKTLKLIAELEKKMAKETQPRKKRELFEQIKPGQRIGFFIGPEGGFDESEITLALENGAQPITLGKRILRTETAGMAVLSILMYHLEGKDIQ